MKKMATVIGLITLCVFVVAMFLFISVLGTEAAEDNSVKKMTAEEVATRPVLEMKQINDYSERIDFLNSKVETTIDDYFQAMDEIPLAPYFQDLAYDLCRKYKVNFAFFLAMAESESTFKLQAISSNKKCIGLMQINKCNWDRYGLDASIVDENIEIGIRMLSELIEKYDNMDAVIMAYKGGEAAADKWIADGVRLSCCDVIEERTVYWQNLLDK